MLASETDEDFLSSATSHVAGFIPHFLRCSSSSSSRLHNFLAEELQSTDRSNIKLVTTTMLLQEHDYRIYRDGEIEDEDQLHELIDNRDSTVSVVFSDPVSSTKVSSPSSSFNKKLRRSTFDMSSVNSLATFSSESGSYYVSTPTRKPSTLRFRQSASRSSNADNSSLPEDAATQAIVQLTTYDETNTVQREGSEECREIMRSRTKTAPPPISKESRSVGLASNVQYFLEVILLGYLIVPFLDLTIKVERSLRSRFGDLQQSVGHLFGSLFASSSCSQEEAMCFGSGKTYSSSNTPMLQQYQLQLSESKADGCGQIFEAASSYSSSSSSEGDSTDEHENEDGWGHFTDFQDELADEASFVPSCSVGPLRTRTVEAVVLPPLCAAALETLTESREEEEDVGEDWTF